MDNTKIAEDYIPFGEEWEKEMSKFPKASLIKMLTEQLKSPSSATPEKSLDDQHQYENGEWARSYTPVQAYQNNFRLEEIIKSSDIAIEFCDKYISKGILEFYAIKQSFVHIKHMAKISSATPTTGGIENGWISKEQAIEVLKKFYELGNEIGYSNTELSRISSCIQKIKDLPPGQSSQPNEVKGGVWVKASDRLPVKRHNYHVKVGYTIPDFGDGIWNTASLFNGETWEHPTEYDLSGKPSKINVIEWLDESQSPIPVQKEKL